MAYCKETRYFVQSTRGCYYGRITTDLNRAKMWLDEATEKFPNEIWGVFEFMD